MRTSPDGWPPAARTTARSAALGLLAGGLALSLVLALAQGAAPAPEPAQLPLRNLAQAPVKPNLMVMLDDSVSMHLQQLPDSPELRVGRWSFRSPALGRWITFHPMDAATPSMGDPSEGVLPSEPGTPYWQQRAMRSPDVNPLYYNPEVRYRPWLRADGSRYPPADITRAPVNPNYPTDDPSRPANDPRAPDSNQIDLTTPVLADKDDPTNPYKDLRWCSTDMYECAKDRVLFVPGLYYRLRRDAQGFLDPQDAASYLEFNINARQGPRRGPGRSDCAAEVCTQAEERQNFANWFVYYRSRLHLARAALGEALLAQGNRVRVGYGRLSARAASQPVDGAGQHRMIVSGVRDWDLAQKQKFADWLYKVPIAGATPLVRAMKEVGRYYERADSLGPWSDTPGFASSRPQASCRRAYHLMITDGQWYEPATPPGTPNIDALPGPVIRLENQKTWQYLPAPPYIGEGTNFLSDAAMDYWYRDLRPDLPNKVPTLPDNEASWQSVSSSFVGLGVNGKLDPATDLPDLIAGRKSWGGDHVDDLWHAAINSRGAYFSALDPESLRKALRDAFARITRQDLSQSGVVAATAEAAQGNRRYQTVFRAADWSGDLMAFPLQAAGSQAQAAWSAERALPPWDQRRIFIRDEGPPASAVRPFRWDLLSPALRSAVGGGAGEGDLVDYLRGNRSLEGNDGWRARGGVLGDFINSLPVVAGDAADPEVADLPDPDGAYARYLAAVKRPRARMVYAGANDGMLHAFRDMAGPDGSPEGQEVFAYIPRAVAAELRRLRDPEYASAPDRHRYLVDGPLRLADVQVPPPGGGPAAWRNYLLASTGAGPSAVFALDVTDPNALDARAPRWELRGADDPRLGHVLAPLSTGQLPNGQWVAVFGNGYGSASGQAHLFVMEVATGVPHVLALPATPQANGLGGVALRRDGQGRVVGLYAGDLAGQLWRFDYSDKDEAFFHVGLGGSPLFRAPAGQAILQAPWVRPMGEGARLAFGTGRLVTDSDATDPTVQAVYVVDDRADETLSRPLQTAQLVERTLSVLRPKDAGAADTFYQVSSPPIDAARMRGWTLPLTGEGVPKGLRVLQPLQALGKNSDLLLIAAEAPAVAGDPCDVAQGEGINLLLKASGSAPSRPVLDTNADGVVNSADAVLAAGYRTLADGADAVLLVPAPAAGSPGAPAPSGPAAAAPCAKQLQLVGSAGGMAACVPGGGALVARVWRRILQPPF